MSIVAADLICYNAINQPTDDTAAGGAGRDVDSRPGFTQLAANDDTEYVSTSASDTMNSTVNGRDATGATVAETLTLTGVTIKTGTQVFERILDQRLVSDAIGTITFRRQPAGATIYTIPIGERGTSALFKRSASSSGIVIRYDKLFWRNNHATLTLTSAKVRLSADPDARIRVGVHTSKGDTATISNRLTAPGGITFVDDNIDQDVPGTTLEAVTDIGVWFEENLPASDPPHRTTFTTQLSGATV